MKSRAYHSQQAGNGAVGSLLVLLIVGFIGLFFFGLDKFGLFDVDEAIFTQASVEMIESGDYVAPTYNGEPRYHKPPLIYWVQSAVMDHFGVSVWSARLPSAFFAFLTLVGFYLFISGMTKNSRYALTATAVLGLNLSYMVISHAATADMALNFFILMATLTLLSNMYATRMDKVAQVIAGLILAMAMLTKGPVALFVPGVAVLWVLITGGQLGYHLRCVNPLVVGVTLLIGILPWCYFIIDAKGMEFFKEFWLVHNLGRFVGGLGNTHSSSGFYYVIVLLIGFFPWVLLLPSAITWLGTKGSKVLKSHDPMDTLPMIGLVWGVAVVVLFSFSATKLPHYIIPALPGFALLIAARLDEIAEEGLSAINWLLFIPMLLLMVGVFFAVKIMPDVLIGEGGSFMLRTMKDLSVAFDFTWPVRDAVTVAILSQDVHITIAPIMVGAIMLIGLTLGWIFLMQGQRVGTVIMAGAMWMSLMLTSLGVVPVVYNYLQKPLVSIGEMIKERHTDGDEVYFLAIHQPSVRFVSGVPFVAMNHVNQMAKHDVPEGDVRVVTKLERKQDVQDLFNETLQSECLGGYCLMTVSKDQMLSLARN